MEEKSMMKQKLFRGIAMVAVAGMMLTGVGCGSNGKDEGAVKPNQITESSASEKESETEQIPALSNYFEVAMNGKVYTVPSLVKDFLTEDDLIYAQEDITGIRGEYWNKLNLYNAENDMYIGQAFTYYEESSSHVIADEYVYWLKFERQNVEASKVSLVFYGGITFDSTYEDIVALFGEPDNENGAETGAYRWEKFCPNADEWCISELSVYFEDGKIDTIYLQHQTKESRFH